MPSATMSLAEATASGFRGFAVLTGRARRSEYWWFSVTYLAVTAPFVVLGVRLESPLLLLPVLAVVPPMLSVSVRRLHDLDRSGRWMLLALVPVAGPLLYLVMMARPGQSGPNRFGPDPKRSDPSTLGRPASTTPASPA